MSAGKAAWTHDVPTRWSDEDRYGHVNNAVAYSVFESVLMHFLERHSGVDLQGGPVRCFTVENGCRYLAPVHHPDVLRTALVVPRIGNSSVRYELVARSERTGEPVWEGYVVDVFVDAATERPVRVPDTVREALAPLLIDSAPPATDPPA